MYLEEHVDITGRFYLREVKVILLETYRYYLNTYTGCEVAEHCDSFCRSFDLHAIICEGDQTCLTLFDLPPLILSMYHNACFKTFRSA